jgi:hypothetical protein
MMLDLILQELSLPKAEYHLEMCEFSQWNMKTIQLEMCVPVYSKYVQPMLDNTCYAMFFHCSSLAGTSLMYLVKMK